MAIDRERLIEIKTVYEIGKNTKVDICKQFGISRQGLDNIANRNQWTYKKLYKNFTNEISQKTYDKLTEDDSDKASKLANDFFQDVVNQKDLIATVLEDYQKTQNEQDHRISKVDAMRLCEAMKFNKITMETLMIGFTGSMKALGLFKEELEITHKLKLDDYLNALPEKYRAGVRERLIQRARTESSKRHLRPV